jgi:hypothetical protein
MEKRLVKSGKSEPKPPVAETPDKPAPPEPEETLSPHARLS